MQDHAIRFRPCDIGSRVSVLDRGPGGRGGVWCRMCTLFVLISTAAASTTYRLRPCVWVWKDGKMHATTRKRKVFERKQVTVVVSQRRRDAPLLARAAKEQGHHRRGERQLLRAPPKAAGAGAWWPAGRGKVLSSSLRPDDHGKVYGKVPRRCKMVHATEAIGMAS